MQTNASLANIIMTAASTKSCNVIKVIAMKWRRVYYCLSHRFI